ncbi:winged helix-turn-helix domain-containing protein [Streptomyces sp. NPDC002490]|uniref:ArsR/SmtB family transcription factor n=1 Tax=Streptomyces sp. NPDC002490 TaxID=3154416 RepID=UPI0033239A4D
MASDRRTGPTEGRMLRLHFTPADLARVRFAPRPAPLQELNAALTAMVTADGGPRRAAWRRRALRSLPRSARALVDLVPAGRAPGFLDVFADSLPAALDQAYEVPARRLRAELEHVYAPVPRPAPAWVRDLHRGDPAARSVVRRAQHGAFHALLGPVWERVQDLHHDEFVRRAVHLAEEGTEAVLAGLLPGARLKGTVWELPGEPRDVQLRGRGLLLLPSFHATGAALPSDVADRPVGLTYPCGAGLLPTAEDKGPGTLGRLLGTTRAEVLDRLVEEHTTGGLARRLGISAAAVSAHTGVLRAAGLISTVRTGKAVAHRRTALGDLVLRRGGDRTGPR